jgi:hypothetical protein
MVPRTVWLPLHSRQDCHPVKGAVFAPRDDGWKRRKPSWKPSRLESNNYNSTPLNRNEFAITDTELKLIAAAAKIGLSNNPNNG